VVALVAVVVAVGVVVAEVVVVVCVCVGGFVVVLAVVRRWR
jgi:hypothetical protein